MLVYLAEYLSNYYSSFHVVSNYVTVRSLLSFVTSLIIILLLGNPLISFLSSIQLKQVVREDGPATHLYKNTTPTMGGILIIVSIILSNQFLWLFIFVLLSFGIIGFLDDFLKIIFNNSRGLGTKCKFLLQSFVTIISVIWTFFLLSEYTELVLNIPFFKNIDIKLGILFFLIGYLVVIGSSNAVNLTDGLDGLVIFPIIMVSGGLGVYAYIITNSSFAGHLLFTYMANIGVEETVVFCATICGAGFGFLWFNSYPADIFMGDVGSLSLGASLGIIALIIRQELILFIMGFLFVIETVSVILQVSSYKIYKKRVFKMAPLHHHFELKGWSENKVVIRFWILSIFFVLIGLIAIKLR